MEHKYTHKKGCLINNIFLIKAHLIKLGEILRLIIKYIVPAIGYTILSQFKLFGFFI